MSVAVRSRRHPAAVVEDRLNAALVALQRRRGWRPVALVYTGYGAAPGVAGVHGDQGWVRVLGRVLLDRPAPAPAGRAAPIRGWRTLLTSQVPGARVTVSVGGVEHAAVADQGGIVDTVVPVRLAAGVHDVRLLPDGGAEGTGQVVVAGPVSHGLVSDIDDTVVVTSLPRPLIAAWNTFVLRESARSEVTGMSAMYGRYLDAHPGAPTVYLSTGAWNAAPALVRFLRSRRYPFGPLLLTDWGPTNTGWFRSGQVHKREALARLTAELPGIRWLLVGDDGQHDPQIYDSFSRAHPDRVHAIAIRQLSPAEQVLASGTPTPTSEPSPEAAPALVVQAPDGHELSDRLREAGVL